MDTNYVTFQTPQFRVLSDRQIEKLYQATLECLNRTGVDVHNAEARDLLAGAGARVDGVRVRIPPHIIQDAIASTPRTFTLWSRDGRPHIQAAIDRVYFGPGPTCTYFMDPHTGERRKTVRGDPAMTARLCDALPNIDYVMSLGLIDDVTPHLTSVYEFAEMICNTTKPVLPWGYTVDHVSDIYQIALVVSGSHQAFRERPFMAFFSTCQPPLIHTDHDVANVLWAVEHDIPVVYLGGGSGGATAPVTAAGTLVVSLAMELSGLAILQLKRRGAPVCLGGVPHPMDLRTIRPSYGSPELSLFSAAMCDFFRHIGLPFMGTAGASESKVVDIQAAIESTFQVIFSCLSGATLVHDVGFLDCADIGSLEMLVMNDEIIAMARRVMRGVEISDETLGLELIDRVGPSGSFLAEMETARQCRREIWTPSYLDRDPWVVWEEAGSRTMLDRIRARIREILSTHEPVQLPAGTAEQIATILEAAEQREGKPSG